MSLKTAAKETTLTTNNNDFINKLQDFSYIILVVCLSQAIISQHWLHLQIYMVVSSCIIDFRAAATADEGHLPTEPGKTGVQLSSESTDKCLRIKIGRSLKTKRLLYRAKSS